MHTKGHFLHILLISGIRFLVMIYFMLDNSNTHTVQYTMVVISGMCQTSNIKTLNESTAMISSGSTKIDKNGANMGYNYLKWTQSRPKSQQMGTQCGYLVS